MIIKVKEIIEEDFINYKKPSMFIAFPTCTFKCEKECGVRCCQNSALATQESVEIDTDLWARRYVANDITSAVVIAGLEPFDSLIELQAMITSLRKYTDDDIVIYTGYNKDEIPMYVHAVTNGYQNIIIKYGRFIPNREPVLDDVLGVRLASNNQYAEVVC